MLKRIFITGITLLTFMAGFAALPKRVSDAAAAVRSHPSVKVDFKVNGNACSMLLDGKGRFALDLGDAKVYYDGKTQWAYSAADNEVTVMEPTAEELAQGNPAAILSNLATSFSGAKVSGETYRLTPVKGYGDIAEVTLCFPQTGVWPKSMTIIAGNGTMNIADMKFAPSKTKPADSAFKFKIPAKATVTKL